MSNRVSDCAAELRFRNFKQRGDDDLRTIRHLELENFDLRNEITRLTVHNATLRRMLSNRNARSE